ncbi:hypothetical protein GCM10008090_23040 [Arenicella chitinivorans]|uniref:CSLREA domain-containing protein n=1 Tax=Arenicella chitinivorans TaxID=1329800 RepID=A0A918RVA9_9GAMM|nr:choice-of-anchor Q domain-containing protein [Arenicella chitinivorans]GHA12526.1 hypothetical protein GCM10008090_23040 [Arenicella chitinivorans]
MSKYQLLATRESRAGFGGPRSILSRAVQTAIISAGLTVPVTQAAQIQVNGFTDDGAGSLCTLREAIATINSGSATADCANSSADAFGMNDTIVFAASNTITLSAGELAITQDVSIDASSVSGATIDAANNSRVIYLSADNLTLTDITLSGGSSSSTGGAVHAPSAATLTLSNSIVTNNQADDEGGGIYLSSSTGTVSSLVLSNSTVSYNNSNYSHGGGIALVGNHSVVELDTASIAENVASYHGGGLYIGSNYVDVALTDSNVTNNVASTMSGGGMHINSPQLGVNLFDSQISGNVAGLDGGGLYLYGTTAVYSTVSLQNAEFSGNTAGVYTAGFGGAMYTRYTRTMIVNSTVSANDATQNGGGIVQIDSEMWLRDTTLSGNSAAQDGGGIYSDYSNLILERTTVSSNSAGSTAGHDGAGVWVSGGTLAMTNSTVSGNSAAGMGGGLYNDADDGTLRHVTFSNNQAVGSGGGVHDASGVLAVINSIIANSAAGGDCSGGAMLDAASIVEDGSCAATRSGDPKLLPLADNGGPTQTHALRANSAAVSTASAAQCEALDQRSETRVASSCDVGAFEFIDQSVFYAIPTKDGKVVIISL